jgi:hypothetical protein
MEKHVSAEEDDGEYLQGTDHSREGPMEPSRLAVVAGDKGDIATLYSAIATFSRGQALMIEKMTLLEKIVGTVQFDMTWVRDDMKAVMERFSADPVLELPDGVAELGTPMEQVSVDAIPPPTWKGKELVADTTKAPSASTSRADRWSVETDDPIHGEGVEVPGVYIDDTEDNVHSPDLDMGRTIPEFEPRRERDYARPSLPALCLAPLLDRRVSIELEPLDWDSQQVEMTCQSTQLPAGETDVAMWSEFAAAVRDWPEKPEAAAGPEEEWVSSKKGQWDVCELVKDLAELGRAAEAEALRTLNLNLLPERDRGNGRAHGRGHPTAKAGIVGANRKFASGSGRGSGRGRGLPAVDPRFHIPVRNGPILHSGIFAAIVENQL